MKLYRAKPTWVNFAHVAEHIPPSQNRRKVGRDNHPSLKIGVRRVRAVVAVRQHLMDVRC